MAVAENQADERPDRDMKEKRDLLTTREMGTTGGTRQIAPGMSFHPVYVISHTQNSCAVSIANSRTKNPATLAKNQQRRKGI